MVGAIKTAGPLFAFTHLAKAAGNENKAPARFDVCKLLTAGLATGSYNFHIWPMVGVCEGKRAVTSKLQSRAAQLPFGCEKG